VGGIVLPLINRRQGVDWRTSFMKLDPMTSQRRKDTTRKHTKTFYGHCRSTVLKPNSITLAASEPAPN